MSEQYQEEDVIRETIIKGERKTFFVSLRQNSRGRFLKVREKSPRGVAVVIVPEDSINDFMNAVISAVQAL